MFNMQRLHVKFHDLSPVERGFEEAVLDGFTRHVKAIPCQYLYDAVGSALFDKICLTPEYYPTRTEIGILGSNADYIAEQMGPGVQIIELGSGASLKVRRLLERLSEPKGYVPVDVSREHLMRAAEDLCRSHPNIPVTAVCADYTSSSWLSALDGLPYTKRVAFFPGSSIGNFEPYESIQLMRHIGSLVGRGGDFLVGVDLKKDTSVLNAAYNDVAGVTAAFNLNLLERINRELGGDFDLRRFRHDATYSEDYGRIEIYIRSLIDQFVHISGRRFRLAAGERIHTEYSYKYTVPEFQALAHTAGFSSTRTWMDDDKYFSVHYLRAR